MKKPSKRSQSSKQIEQLEKLQTQYTFKQLLTFYQMGVSGRPEEQEQKAFFNCLRGEFPELLGFDDTENIYRAIIVATADFYDAQARTYTRITSRGSSSKIRASSKMQKKMAMGYQPGTPDMIFLTPHGIYHGLVIEMKSITGSAIVQQKKTIAYLCSHGYSCHICKGFAEALKVFLEYFELI